MISIMKTRNMPSDQNKLVIIFLATMGTLVLIFFFSSFGGTSFSFKIIEEELTIVTGDITKKHEPFVPSRNASKAERIAWLLMSLPELKMFKPASEFHSRAVRFFDARCEVRVFMTWTAPAEKFGRREFLAMESFFKANPKGCLMILSRTLDSVEGHRILKPVLDRRLRVVAVTPDLSYLVNGSSGESWLEDLKRGTKDPI